VEVVAQTTTDAAAAAAATAPAAAAAATPAAAPAVAEGSGSDSDSDDEGVFGRTPSVAAFGSFLSLLGLQHAAGAISGAGMEYYLRIPPAACDFLRSSLLFILK